MKNFTKMLSVLLIFTLSAIHLNAQTVLIDPAGDGGFETGADFASNGWTVVNGTPTNRWVCNTGATAGFSGTRCAYLTNNDAGSPPPHTYTTTAAAAVHLYRDITFPIGETLINFNFNIRMTGETNWDRLLVYISNGTPSGTPVAGTPSSNTTSLTGYTLLSTEAIASSWSNRVVAISAAQAGNAAAASTRRILFVWQNDGGGGSQPPVAIDNISLTSNTPPPPPANDNCAGAVSLTVNSDLACAVTTAGTTVSATQTSGETVPTCGATGINDDVWFSFVATGTSHRIQTSSVSIGTGGMQFQVYGGTCGALTTTGLTGACGTFVDVINVSGLTASTTYYVRVATATATTTTNATFNICVGTPPPAPANDICSGAISLTPGLTCLPTTGNTNGATDNDETGDCVNGTENAVWYKFVATAVTHTVVVDGALGFDAVIGALVTCGSSTRPTGGSCTDNTLDDGIETMSLSGLTIGTTYYIQVHDYEGDNTASSTFTICVIAPPPPPANDNCAGATSFAISPIGMCSFASVTSNGATQTASPVPNCTSTANNDDIWFTINPTVSTTHTLRFQNMVANSGTATQLGYELYSSTSACVLTLVTGSCVTTVSTGGSGSITPTLTSGITYYLRVWTTGTSNSATWDMCLEQNPLPLSDNICNAPEVTVGSTGILFNTSGATTQTGESTSCTPPSSSNGPSRGNANWNFNSPNISTTVWAKFVAPASGNVEILAATTGDSQMGLFKGAPTGCPTPSFSGMSHLQSNDDDIISTSSFQSRIRARLNPGETYYVLVDGYTTSVPSGTLTVTELTTVTANDGIGDIYTTTPVQSGNYEVNSDHSSDQGWSYYYYNNGTTTNMVDDRVVLALKKNGNNLGVYAVSATAAPSFSTTSFNVWGGIGTAGATTLSTAPYVSPTISWAMMNRYWNVVPQIQPGSAVDVRFYYQDADYTALQTITSAFSPSVPLASKTDMVMLRFRKNTGHWNNTELNPTGGHTALTNALGTIVQVPSGSWTNTVLPSGVNQAQFSVTAFSGGGAGGGTGSMFGPLPIELKSFTGKSLKASNQLEWITSTEEGVKEHIIERSANGYNNWTLVGTTPSKGDARADQSYSMEDKTPLTKSFYRLRSLDLDGREQFSNVISLTRQNNSFGVIAAYPNPAVEMINVQFNTLEEGNITARIVDMTGRLVLEQQMSALNGTNMFTVQLHGLSAGTYFITLSSNNEVAEPIRFVKQ